MKVLHLLSSSNYSGAENIACNIIEMFNYEYEMYYCSPRGSIETVLKKNKIKYIPLNNIFSIKKSIKKINPDIIHAHDFKMSILAAVLFKNKKVISHIHKNDPSMKKWTIKSILYKLLSKNFYKIICVSNSINDEWIIKKDVKDKTKVIYNKVNSIKIKKLANEKADKYDVIFVGRLTDVKNPMFFVEIAKEMKNEKIKFALIGDGDLKDEITDKIKEYEIEKKVELLGFKNNPYSIIKNAKVVVMPSKWEGFGLSAIESLCLGIPVINSGVGGLKEIFKENLEYICGFEIKKYVDKIKTIINNSNNINVDISEYTDMKAWKNQFKSIYEKGDMND